MSRDALDALPEGDYRVRIDSTLADGSLTYGETVLEGRATTSSCSRRTSATRRSRTTTSRGSCCSGRSPGRSATSACDTPIASSGAPARSARSAGCTGTATPSSGCATGSRSRALGDPGALTYKRSRRGDTAIDEAAAHVVAGAGGEVLDGSPTGETSGSSARRASIFRSARLSRTPADAFPEYHSSADDLELVRPEALGDSFRRILEIVDVIESDGTYVNRLPFGEPFLGKRGLYRSVGGDSSRELALLWALSLCDGSRTLLEVAERARLPFAEIRAAARLLAEHELLERSS